MYSAGSMATTNTTTSTGAMGGLGTIQNSMPNVGAIAPTITSNGIGSASMASGQSVDATLSQAYTGIQQYAGLSGLVNQGKFHSIILAFSVVEWSRACCCGLWNSLAFFLFYSILHSSVCSDPTSWRSCEVNGSTHQYQPSAVQCDQSSGVMWPMSCDQSWRDCEQL